MADGPSDAAARTADFAHCADEVRQQDPDRATAVLFAAPDRRDALHALYAFDLETGQIRDRIRQPIAGEIRLQWWRDTIAAKAGGQGSPVAEALMHAIRAYDLPVDAFERLLDARIFDLYDDPMPSREAFETYAGETASTVVMLAAMILDRAAAPSVAAVAGHAGVALAAVQVLRDEEKLVSRGQVYVPEDLLTATGRDRASYLAQEGDRGAVHDAMCAFATEHLTVVEREWAGIAPSLRPAFLPVRRLRASLGAAGTPRSHSRGGALARSFLYWRAMRERGR